MAKLKSEFENQAHFVVLEGGKNKRVPAAVFKRESAKYIGLGYGRYFEISEEDANKLAAKGLAERKAQKLKEEQRLATLKETAEKTSQDLVAATEELKNLDKQLGKTKKLVDEQQKTNANLTNENAQLKKELELLLKKQSTPKVEDAPKKEAGK